VGGEEFSRGPPEGREGFWMGGGGDRERGGGGGGGVGGTSSYKRGPGVFSTRESIEGGGTRFGVKRQIENNDPRCFSRGQFFQHRTNDQNPRIGTAERRSEGRLGWGETTRGGLFRAQKASGKNLGVAPLSDQGTKGASGGQSISEAGLLERGKE